MLQYNLISLLFCYNRPAFWACSVTSISSSFLEQSTQSQTSALLPVSTRRDIHTFEHVYQSACTLLVMANLYPVTKTNNQFDRSKNQWITEVYMWYYRDYHGIYRTISEYAAKGCLYDHLANNKLNFDQILRWSTEIALGKQVILK